MLACRRPRNSRVLESRQIAACSDDSASAKVDGVGTSLAGAVGRSAFDEAFREHELPLPDADLPTAPASDVPTPSTFAEAESSELAAIWRDSRTREFRGLLQANTFGPA